MTLIIENAGLDEDAKDIVVDNKVRIHIKRTDCGYVLDFLNTNGDIYEDLLSYTIWDEDIESDS